MSIFLSGCQDGFRLTLPTIRFPGPNVLVFFYPLTSFPHSQCYHDSTITYSQYFFNSGLFSGNLRPELPRVTTLATMLSNFLALASSQLSQITKLTGKITTTIKYFAIICSNIFKQDGFSIVSQALKK